MLSFLDRVAMQDASAQTALLQFMLSGKKTTFGMVSSTAASNRISSFKCSLRSLD